MGDFGYIFGYMLFFAFCVGGVVGSASTYYILKHEKEDK